jgi:hypothetical protein
MLFRSATMPRSKSESGIAGTRVAKSVPSSPEILSEEPHHDERVESETAIAQQIPNFHTRSKGERILVRAASGKKEAKYESIVSRLAFGSAACRPA